MAHKLFPSLYAYKENTKDKNSYALFITYIFTFVKYLLIELADANRFELLPTVLETAMLPLHQAPL